MYEGAFLMRGLANARAEFSLTALAYNVRRALNILGVEARPHRAPEPRLRNPHKRPEGRHGPCHTEKNRNAPRAARVRDAVSPASFRTVCKSFARQITTNDINRLHGADIRCEISAPRPKPTI